MKTLKDIPHLDGVKVLVRADFNVPIKNGQIVDDFRIVSTLPTLEFLRSRGAIVILVSHLEVGEGENPTLEPVAEKLKALGIPVTFVKEYRNLFEIIENQTENGCFLLENVRFNDGEKKNDPKFSRELASLADIFVNDAFSVCHREHASVVGVPKYLPSYAGLQLEKEITNLSKVFDPAHPFLFVLGGAKFETKMPLLEKFLKIADTVFVGGALANDMFKARGYEVGMSLTSKEDIDLSKLVSDPKLLTPIDVIDQQKNEKDPRNVSKGDKIVDAGPASVKMLAEKISQAKCILWNGPLGVYEDGFHEATLELARLIGKTKERGGQSFVGGGDTLAAIEELNIQDSFTFISTGGGAMLDFLAKGTLPGVEALNASDS